MARLYLDERLSIHEIARRTHWAVGSVHRALRADGVQMRPVGVVLGDRWVRPTTSDGSGRLSATVAPP
jgi:predicted transcriptional regulator